MRVGFLVNRYCNILDRIGFFRQMRENLCFAAHPVVEQSPDVGLRVVKHGAVTGQADPVITVDQSLNLVVRVFSNLSSKFSKSI